MTRPTNAQLRKLLTSTTSNYGLTEDDHKLVEIAHDLARELLAARKVVGASKAYVVDNPGFDDWSCNERLAKALNAYDKRAAKGKV